MSPRRLISLALALAALALALPTVAAPLTNALDAGVTVTTENSANAGYVQPTADGNATLDLSASNPALAGDGPNPAARTYVADAFRIRYDGDTAATVWIETDAAGITFLAGTDPVDSRADAVALEPGETVTVGVVVDTTGDVPSTAEFAVRARVADEGSSPPDPDSTPAGAPADPPEPTTIRVASPTATSRNLAVRDARTGRPVTLDLDRLVVARAGDGVAALSELTVVGGGDLDLGVTATSADTVGGLPADAPVRPLGAVRVEERRGDVDRATLRFGVDRTYLDAIGYAPEDLTVYRYDGTGWSERGVEVAARGDERIVLESETPGFSTFVVAAKGPDLRVTTADLRTASVSAGESATVTAEVVNGGGVGGSRTVTLTLDGDPVAERRVDLAPGASTTVAFQVDPSEPGTYGVAVGSAEAGGLTVEAADTDDSGDGGPPAATPAPGDTSPGTPADGTATPAIEPAGGAPAPTLWLGVGLLALVVFMTLVRRLGGVVGR